MLSIGYIVRRRNSLARSYYYNFSFNRRLRGFEGTINFPFKTDGTGKTKKKKKEKEKKRRKFFFNF